MRHHQQPTIMGSLLLLMMIMTMMMVSLSSSHAQGIVTEATAPFDCVQDALWQNSPG